MKGRTSCSALEMYDSIARLAPFATAFANNGSNLAASSSFTIALAVAIPSFAVGSVGGLAAENELARLVDDEMLYADPTASVRRLLERVR